MLIESIFWAQQQLFIGLFAFLLFLFFSTRLTPSIRKQTNKWVCLSCLLFSPTTCWTINEANPSAVFIIARKGENNE